MNYSHTKSKSITKAAFHLSTLAVLLHLATATTFAEDTGPSFPADNRGMMQIDLYYIPSDTISRMSNETLQNLARDLANNQEMRIHNIHNYYWLKSFEHGTKHHEGEKAFRKFSQKVVKHYWKAMKDSNKTYSKYIPPTNNSLKVNYGGADYTFRVSQSGIKVNFLYEF